MKYFFKLVVATHLPLAVYASLSSVKRITPGQKLLILENAAGLFASLNLTLKFAVDTVITPNQRNHYPHLVNEKRVRFLLGREG